MGNLGLGKMRMEIAFWGILGVIMAVPSSMLLAKLAVALLRSAEVRGWDVAALEELEEDEGPYGAPKRIRLYRAIRALLSIGVVGLIIGILWSTVVGAPVGWGARLGVVLGGVSGGVFGALMRTKPQVYIPVFILVLGGLFLLLTLALWLAGLAAMFSYYG
jgi:hypothetical protein